MLRDFTTAFRRTGALGFTGLAIDRHYPDRILVVEIIIDGIAVSTVRADQRAPAFDPEQQGNAGHGFVFDMPDDVVRDAVLIEARLANLGTPVGAPIRLDRGFEATPPSRDPGEVNWLGGLHVSGWCTAPEAVPLAILIDGVLVDHVRPTAWKQVGSDPRTATPVQCFTAHLPVEFADGVVHRCTVLTSRNDPLGGSPFAFVAFQDTLRGAVLGSGASERDLIRAELFDRLVPLSVPFSDYEAWRASERPEVGCPTQEPCAVIMIGEGAANDTLESLAGQSHDNWVAVSLSRAAEPTGFDNASLKRVVEQDAGHCRMFVFALSGTVLRASALQRIAYALSAVDGAIAVYPDVDLQAGDGSVWPLAFPIFDYERMLEQGYCTLLFALSRAATLRSLAAGADTLQRLFSAALDEGPRMAASVIHCPGSLAILPRFEPSAIVGALANSSLDHLARRGVAARVGPAKPGVLPAVRVVRAHANPRTTLVIPSRNRRDLLEACVESIMPAVRRHTAEILIVDNDTTEVDALRYLRRLQTRGVETIRAPGAFNFARLANRGVAEAHGDLVCLLNNDVVALDADWLDEMLGRMADESVGVVAPLLVWPSRIVQHGGIVLGPKFEVAHAFTDRLDSDGGYGDLLRVAHECSAVTAACLLTRRADYRAVGGMDETRFPINFNDVDYCLKVREAGKRIVITPHAKLIHAESSSRGSSWSPDRRALFERERRSLQLKWGRVLVDDPFYSPILSLDPNPYAALAAHTRSLEPRSNACPVSVGVPDGF